MGNRKSVMRQKEAVAKARTYPNPREAMLVERCGCDVSGVPSQETLDQIADAEIAAGWDISRENMCLACNVAKAYNGRCPLCGEHNASAPADTPHAIRTRQIRAFLASVRERENERRMVRVRDAMEREGVDDAIVDAIMALFEEGK